MIYLVFAVLFACLSITSVILYFKKTTQRFPGTLKALCFFGVVECVIAALAAYLFFRPPIWEFPGTTLFILAVLFLFCAIVTVAAAYGTKQPQP